MESALAACSLFDVSVCGVIVARYALKTIDRAAGSEMYVVAAAGAVPGADLVAGILPFIETQCTSVDCLTVNTRRRGLVKKLQRQGWTLDAYVMRKKIK